MSSRSRILIADDHRVVIGGVRELLGDTDEFAIVAQALTGNQCLAAAERHRPDLILLDLRLPDMEAPEVCRLLAQTVPDTKVFIFTAFDDAQALAACMREGAMGVLIKDVHGLDLIGGLRRVLSGQRVIDARLRGKLSEHGSGRRAGWEETTLTVRERQILNLLAEGLTSKEMAAQLNLSLNTVRSYAQDVLKKLNVSSRMKAVGAARQRGLL